MEYRSAAPRREDMPRKPLYGELPECYKQGGDGDIKSIKAAGWIIREGEDYSFEPASPQRGDGRGEKKEPSEFIKREKGGVNGEPICRSNGV